MQTWSDVLGKEKQQEYFQETLNFIRHERESGKIIYPPAADVFNAFKYTEFADVKVVIIGQYPYTVQVRRMAFAFLYCRVLLFRPHWSISIKNYFGMYLGLRSLSMAIFCHGPSRACCY